MTQIPWTSADAAVVREFFETDTGKRYLEILRLLRPSFSGLLPEQHNLIFRNGSIHGYEICLDALLLPTRAEFLKEPDTHENYPSLDDEDKWKKD